MKITSLGVQKPKYNNQTNYQNIQVNSTVSQMKAELTDAITEIAGLRQTKI